MSCCLARHSIHTAYGSNILSNVLSLDGLRLTRLWGSKNVYLCIYFALLSRYPWRWINVDEAKIANKNRKKITRDETDGWMKHQKNIYFRNISIIITRQTHDDRDVFHFSYLTSAKQSQRRRRSKRKQTLQFISCVYHRIN